MTAEQMWHAFCESSGVSEQTPYSAWAFCGGGAVGDGGVERRGVSTVQNDAGFHAGRVDRADRDVRAGEFVAQGF